MIESHHQRTDTERPDATALGIPLLHASNVLGDILDRDGILNRQTMRLRLDSRLVDQYPSISVQAGECQSNVGVEQTDLGWCDACVLELHGRALLAA